MRPQQDDTGSFSGDSLAEKLNSIDDIGKGNIMNGGMAALSSKSSRKRCCKTKINYAEFSKTGGT